MFAVRLHHVTSPVKRDSGDLRAARVADTEERILEAARELFLARGYAATTLADVATHARVGARTVYVRFGTKAALLRRVIGVALVGDTAPIDVAHRPWIRTSMTALTLAERLDAFIQGSAGIMGRAGALFAVAGQAEAFEDEVAAAAQAARDETREHVRGFWRAAAAAGLLPPGSDAEWLGDTVAVLCAGDTYVHIARTMRWDMDEYARWLRTTLYTLAGLPSNPAGQPS